MACGAVQETGELATLARPQGVILRALTEQRFEPGLRAKPHGHGCWTALIQKQIKGPSRVMEQRLQVSDSVPEEKDFLQNPAGVRVFFRAAYQPVPFFQLTAMCCLLNRRRAVAASEIKKAYRRKW